MIVVLSPSKALNCREDAWDVPKVTQPLFVEQASELIEILRGYSLEDLRKLMKISDELASLNLSRYMDFETPFTAHNAQAAITMFNGDVYEAMDVRTRFSRDDYLYAHDHLRILSGLYGLIRPLDLVQPYRLEMGIKLANPGGSNLYQYWSQTLTSTLERDLGSDGVLVNLASNEYSDVIDPDGLGAQIVAPRFEDISAQGKRSVISFYAKRARGRMAAWIVTNRIDNPADLADYDRCGYRYDAERSTPTMPVFVRDFDDRGVAN